MKKNLFRAKKGMVLVIVIAAIAMMSIVVMGMLSRNVSRGLTAENQIKRLQAETLAKGAFWRAYQNDGIPPTDGLSEGVGGTTYTVSYTTVAAAGPGGTNKIETKVTH